MNAQTISETGTEACEICRYWKEPAAVETQGQCRRHAPQSIVFQVDEKTEFVSRFPATEPADWCGDFQRS